MDDPALNTKKEVEMSFLDHLEVLRWHLIRSAIAIISVSILAFVNKSFVFDKVVLGPMNPNFLTYRVMCWISDVICIDEIPFILMNINMSGQFTNHIFVSIIAGFVVSFPYVCWEVWRFIKPALYNKESKHSKGVVFFSSTLFITGVLFGYYVIAPLAINFLGSYQVSEKVVNQINLGSFMTTVASVSLACGVIFELPIVTYFLTKLGILGPQIMRKYRKHALVVTLILSAIITPPDVISQILVALPLLVLYEVSIHISAFVEKRADQ
jgi:sec-independent protein translocase protein TatC